MRRRRVIGLTSRQVSSSRSLLQDAVKRTCAYYCRWLQPLQGPQCSSERAASPALNSLLRTSTQGFLPPFQQPLIIVVGSPACSATMLVIEPFTSAQLYFTSSLTCASPLHRGASLTAHKTSMAHDESTPVAPWHARACKATLCLQAPHAPCLRHRLTPCETQFRSQTGIPLLQRSRSAPEMLQMSQSAILKIHR
jgi:hypothetical protein